MEFVCPKCGSNKMELQGNAEFITWEINLENYPEIEYDNPCVCEQTNKRVVCWGCGHVLIDNIDSFDADDDIREYLEKNGDMENGN